jgi:pimeloyl-ACP methyl ester carboxylesterase
MEGTVVLLHGLGRSNRSMARLEASIVGAGFETRNLAYQSRRCGVREAAEEVSFQLGDLRVEQPLIGVTHSMGGLVLRALASRFNWQGCVMLGPPNHASGLASSVSRIGLFRWLMGPACIELGKELRWPDPPRPCGIIVGTAGMTLDNPPSWLAGLRGVFEHDEVHDGTVSLSEAAHAAATDLALVDASHTRIMDHPETIKLVLKFLQTGGFGTAGMEPAMAEAIERADSLHYG